MSVKFWSFAAIVALAAYLIGSVSFAVIVSRVGAQDDVRRHGSGNAGMTNILRNYGKKMAAFTALGDFGKGIVAVAVGRMIFTLAGITVLDGGYIAGFFVVLGHLFPLYFGFKGGKGVLTTAGMILFVDWRIFLIVVAVFVVVLVLSRMVSLASVSAAVAYPLATFSMTYFLDYFSTPTHATFTMVVITTTIALVMGVIVIAKHRTNLVRIFRGEEKQIGAKKKEGEG